MFEEEQMGPMPEQPVDFMPVGGMGVGAPQPQQMQYGGLSADHILTIRQGGREENYRYNQDPQGQLQMDPYDAGMAQRRMIQAQQAQQLRRQPKFTPHDDIRLRKLEATRAWAENEFQTGRMHISNFNDVMGQVEALATPLDIKKQQVQQAREDRLKQEQVDATRVINGLEGERDKVTMNNSDSLVRRRDFPDGSAIVIGPGKDGKIQVLHTITAQQQEGEDLKLAEAKTKAKGITNTKDNHDAFAQSVAESQMDILANRSPQRAVNFAMDKQQELLEQLDSNQNTAAKDGSVSDASKEEATRLRKQLNSWQTKIEKLFRRMGGPSQQNGPESVAPPAELKKPPEAQPAGKPQTDEAARIKAELERRRLEAEAANPPPAPGQMRGGALGLPGGGHIRIQ